MKLLIELHVHDLLTDILPGNDSVGASFIKTLLLLLHVLPDLLVLEILLLTAVFKILIFLYHFLGDLSVLHDVSGADRLVRVKEIALSYLVENRSVCALALPRKGILTIRVVFR